MSQDKPKKPAYLDLSDHLWDLRYGFGVKDKTVAGLKLLGKGMFNVAKYTVTEALPQAAKQMEERVKQQTEAAEKRK